MEMTAMNNMNERKLEGAKWLEGVSSKDGVEECKHNFLTHIVRRHEGKVNDEYIKNNGERCEECWNLAMRVVRTHRQTDQTIAIHRNQWTEALKASGMKKYGVTVSDGNGDTREVQSYWQTSKTSN